MVSALIDLNTGWQGFVTILLLIFGLFMILAGAFTAYFGSGKSRTIGVGLLVLGLVVGIGCAYWYHLTSYALVGLLEGTILVLVAAAAGALLAILIFLFAIMKS
jgi:hypothetical protein